MSAFYEFSGNEPEMLSLKGVIVVGVLGKMGVVNSLGRENLLYLYQGFRNNLILKSKETYILK